MQQLKGGNNPNSMWAKLKQHVQDPSVDAAMNEQKTHFLYQQYLEQQKKWAQPEWKENDRPSIISDYDKKKNNDDNDDNDDDDKKKKKKDDDDDFDDNEFLNDPDIQKLHEKRLEELKQEYKKKQQDLIKGGGKYQEMDERSFLKMAVDNEYIVVHFYTTGFERCDIVDEHLKRIAPKQIDVKFVKLNAKKAPFLVNKWSIKTLPTICVLIRGYLMEKIIGFDEFGGKDDFPTIAMEKKLYNSGVLKGKEGKRLEKIARTQILA